MKCASYNQDKAYYKIGFTYDITKRLTQYITHNPTIKLLEMVDTYKKTKHSLEKALHKELKQQGYKFTINYGISTEWIEVDKDRPISLKNFNSCKNRKVITL
jgi:hypothetical protein